MKEKGVMILFAFVILMISSSFVGAAVGGIIPADRLVSWQGNVGVEGGIPARTLIRNCVASDNVPTNGISDATGAIRNCLTNTPLNAVAYLPAGTYLISGRISIPSNKTLRGAGMSATTLLNTNNALDSVLYIGNGQTSGSSLIGVTSGYTKGSNQLTLSDASTISVGNFVVVDELNDPTIPVTPTIAKDINNLPRFK